MELKPAVCLDFDGTIRHSKNGNKFIKGIDDIALYDGVEATLHDYATKGYLILGATNQGGVAYGITTPEQMAAQLAATLELFEDSPFFRVECCFCHPNGKVPQFARESMMRKPNTGMLAILEDKCFKDGIMIDWSKSIFVGDRDEDQECARRAGIQFQWAWDFFGREKPESED